MWDATSRSMHFRFDALRDGPKLHHSTSIIPDEPELRSNPISFNESYRNLNNDTTNYNSPMKKTKNVKFYTPMPKSKKLDNLDLDDSFARDDDQDLLDFDKINTRYSKPVKKVATKGYFGGDQTSGFGATIASRAANQLNFSNTDLINTRDLDVSQF